ncbi:LysR family transcriptional regulator [Roseomonas sp. PWR1]|uniref:LysR family transcriptional regulator n=1 Tax=Roseomonas nitratireducens TaxID=2820810 RepID=A0ABS4B1Y6_9PROT|nr:LysR family transcriptional regulator [Neoroseomonas nitratireducens]MBP0466857.1 LysR family transcriptional regulator [Neoroseomonas nitratireducens]
MTSLRGLDLNLLLVFEALFETRSVSRAGERLGLSQSATSHALARLREACRDELFLRTPSAMVPTPVANRIFPDVHAALDSLRQSVEEARGFDAASSTRRFDVAIPHPLGPAYAMRIRDAAAAEAPGVQLRFDTRTLADDAPGLMRDGVLDLAVDWIAASEDRFVNKKLFEDGLVIVARHGHPRAFKGMGWRELAKEEFVRSHRRAPERRPKVLQGKLWDLMADSRLIVSEYLEVPFTVSRTDCLGVLPRSMARIAETEFGMVVTDVPGPPIRIPIWLVWHEGRRRDAGHAWLRALVTREVQAAAAESGLLTLAMAAK